MTALTNSGIQGQAGLAQSQRAQQDVQEQSRQIDNLKRDLNPVKDKSKKLREACEGFESVFIQKMWEQMRATVPKGGMLQGRDEQYWQGMFDQELSKKMSSAGGIGLADMMYEQLSRNLVSASRTTASGLGAAQKKSLENTAADTGFVVTAAPLLPPADTQSTGKADADNKKGMYSAEASQPEAEEDGGQSQSADTVTGQAGQARQKQPGQQEAVASATGATPATGAAAGAGDTSSPTNPAPSDTPPEVQQVLNQLRAQAGVGGVGNTMTGAQAIAAVQAMTPMQALALSQGKTWAEVQGMNPAMGGIPTGLDAARAAAQTANTRMPAGGVLPPMTQMQRQAQMHYSAAKVAGSGGSSHSRNGTPPPVPGVTPPAVPGIAQPTVPGFTQPTVPGVAQVPGTTPPTPVSVSSSTMPTNPHLFSNVQGSPGVSPSHFVQNSPLIPAANAVPAAPGNPLSMTAEQISALSAQPAQAGQAAQGAPNAQTAPMGQAGQAGPAGQTRAAAAAASPAIPATAQEPQIINTTFTTNIPPKRRNGRQGQRMAKGQAAIRSLNAG